MRTNEVAELYANVPMGSRYPAAHELFMGVYHSHSIQIARLIERAYPFARPSPAVSHFTFSLPPPLHPHSPLNTSCIPWPFPRSLLSRPCNFILRSYWRGGWRNFSVWRIYRGRGSLDIFGYWICWCSQFLLGFRTWIRSKSRVKVSSEIEEKEEYVCNGCTF